MAICMHVVLHQDTIRMRAVHCTLLFCQALMAVCFMPAHTHRSPNRITTSSRRTTNARCKTLMYPSTVGGGNTTPHPSKQMWHRIREFPHPNSIIQNHFQPCLNRITRTLHPQRSTGHTIGLEQFTSPYRICQAAQVLLASCLVNQPRKKGNIPKRQLQLQRTCVHKNTNL